MPRTTVVHADSHKKQRKLKKPISHTRKPEDMTLEQWQLALRKQAAGMQRFVVKNLGQQPVFSDFHVTNPISQRSYRVAIRGGNPGDNFCSCPDFAVNTLGTCKHVEHVLHRLRRGPEGKRAFKQGFLPEHSEIYLR